MDSPFIQLAVLIISVAVAIWLVVRTSQHRKSVTKANERMANALEELVGCKDEKKDKD